MQPVGWFSASAMGSPASGLWTATARFVKQRASSRREPRCTPAMRGPTDPSERSVCPSAQSPSGHGRDVRARACVLLPESTVRSSCEPPPPPDATSRFPCPSSGPTSDALPPCQCGAASTVSVGCDSCACDQQMRTALDVVRFHASCSPSSASCSCAGEADGGRPRSVSVDGFDSTVDGAVLRQRDRGFGHPTHACECRRRALCRWWFWGGVRLEPSRCDARRRVRTSSCSSIPWRCGSRSGQRTVSMPPGHISRTLDDPAVSRRP